MTKTILFCVAIIVPSVIVRFIPTTVAAFLNQPVVSGISRYDVAYLFYAYGAIVFVNGWRFYRSTLAKTVFVLFPIFFFGPLIAVLSRLPGVGNDHGAYYLGLIVTMLTVIPLALAVVSLLRQPATDYERYAVVQSKGVSLLGKIILLACRVFVHILFFVLPALMAVLREEQFFERIRRTKFRVLRLRTVPAFLIRVVCQATCATLQYLVLWVSEISALPSSMGTRGVSHVES